MKAISPALPMTAPSRQPSGVDTAAADEAFGALIAAVIGAPVAASTPSSTPPSSPQPPAAASAPSRARVGKADDARPAADTATAADTAPVAADTEHKADDAEKPDKDADPAAATVTTSQDPTAKSRPEANPPLAARIPAGLEKAAAALAEALTAAPVGTAKTPAVGSPAASAPATRGPAQPGNALTEGQLPTQLVTAVTAAHAGTNVAAATASGVNAGDGASELVVTPAVGESTTQATSVLAAQPKPAEATSAGPERASVTTPESLRLHASSGVVSAEAAASTANVDTTTNRGEAKPTTADRPIVGDSASALPAQLPTQLAPMTTPPAHATTTPQPQAYPLGVVPQQIVQVVAPLRAAKDGDYTLSLQLHPAELGAVTVRVAVQQGVLSVHMSADHAHGHDALAQSLADLRTQLQASGVRTGDIAVVAAKQSMMPQHQDQQQHTSGRQHQEAPTYDDAGADRGPTDHTSHQTQARADDDTVDVRI